VPYERRVSWNDCDPSGLIRYQAAFDWFVDAEKEFLRSRGVAWVFGNMPRVACNATYRLPLRYDDPFTVEVEVAQVGRSSVTFRFVANDESGAEAVSAEVTCVYVQDGRSATLPDDLREALA
jgi:YbgC/YbaW family acyl-CoA thioester hydrolase